MLSLITFFIIGMVHLYLVRGMFINVNLMNLMTSRLFKSFEFGNGSRMSDENLVILESKYLQNKKC